MARKRPRQFKPSQAAREAEKKFLQRVEGGNFDHASIFNREKRSTLGRVWAVRKVI